MKFTVEQSALVDGVNWVSRSLSTRPIMTALLGIVIDASGDEVFLSGSEHVPPAAPRGCKLHLQI